MESLEGSAQHHTAIVNGTVLISVPALSNVSTSSWVGPGSLCAALMLVALLFPLVPVVVPIPAPHAVCGGCACRLLLARPAPAINDGGPGVVCPGRRGAVTSAFARRPDRSRCLRGPGVGVIGSPHVLRHGLVYLGRPCARRPGGRRAARPRPPRSRGRSSTRIGGTHRPRPGPTPTDRDRAPITEPLAPPEYAQPTLTRASRAALVHRNRSDKPTDAGPKLSPRTQQSGLRPSARRAASPPPRRRHERPISTFRQACSGTPRSSGHRRTDGWSPAGCGRSPAPVGQRFRGAAGPPGVPMARPRTGGQEIAGVS